MDRRGIIGVVIGVMVAIGVVLWMNRDADRDDQSQAVTEASGSEPSPVGDADSVAVEDVSAETSEDPGYVTRLPNYAATDDLAEPHWSEMDLPRQIGSGNVVTLTERLIEAALAGNAGAVLELEHAKRMCSFAPGTPEELAEFIQKALDRAGHNTRPLSAGEYRRPGSAIGTREEILEDDTAWYLACERQRRLLGDEFRARVERLAAGGNVAARLLYAALRPETEHNPDWINDIEYWEARAREFTGANLDERRAEGLLGRYLGFGEGFQSIISDEATAYLIAAHLCGIKHPELAEITTHYLESLSDEGSDFPEYSRARIPRMAADLHQRYCFNAP